MLFKKSDWLFGAHIFVLGLPVRARWCLRIFDRSTGTFFDVWNQLDLRVIRAKIEGGYSLPLGRVLKGARGF